MTDSEIIKTIDNFISSSIYNYAVLIDGDWGCGKTYFIENVLLPHLTEPPESESKIRVEYISLYGIKSTEEISSIINARLLSEAVWRGPLKKASDVVKRRVNTIVGSAIGAVSKQLLNNDYSEDVKNTIQEFLSKDNVIFIFDDLERCSFDVCDALGYINNLVEHAECKVILVANEQEIGKWQMDINPEAKYMVAANSDINIPHVESQTEHMVSCLAGQNGKAKKDSKISLNELDERVDALFGTNERYIRTKEKIIGLTIRYTPDLKAVFTNLIESRLDIRSATTTNVRDYILEKIPFYVHFMEEVGHRNVRTIQFFIEKINLIAGALENSFVENYGLFNEDAGQKAVKEAIGNIIDYCFSFSVAYKMGTYSDVIENRDNAAEWADVPLIQDDVSSRYHMTGFRFIYKLIVDNTYDNKEIPKICRDYVRECIEYAKSQYSPINKLKNWYFYSEGDTRNYLQQIRENIKSGTYSVRVYSQVLEIVSKISVEWNERSLLDDIVTDMEEHIKSADAVADFEDRSFIDFSSAEGQQYKHAMNKVKAAITGNHQSENQQKYYEMMKRYGDEWGQPIYDDLFDDIRHGRKTTYFILEVSPEDIAEQLFKHSSNTSILNFHYYLMDYAKNVSPTNKQREKLSELRKTVNDKYDKNSYDKTQQVLYGLAIRDLSQWNAD